MSPKEINQKSLVRIFKDIKRLNTEEIRFCFLIGAGASKSSGIPTGYELALQWYNSLTEDLDKDNLQLWEASVAFDKEKIGEFYPQLYKKRFESSPQLGYEEFKKLMDDKDPSIGYVILSQILALERHNFVITTNFDYLIEDAVRMYTATRPFSAGHETLAGFISSQTERPTIIKVHRDLFLNPFNDKEKTDKLKDEWKDALRPILRNFNLLVLGYGGNDGSLMDYLHEIRLEDRKPIYWCKREEDQLCKKVEALITSNDFIVTINDFDELMYALHDALKYDIFSKINKPDEHIFVTNTKLKIEKLNTKLKEILDGLSQNESKISSTSNVESLFTGPLDCIYKAIIEKDINKKIEIYSKGLENYPKDTSLLVNFAIALSDDEIYYDKAENLYKNALEIQPENASICYNYGIFLIGVRKDYIQAEIQIKKAIDLDPHNSYYHKNYAIFLSSNLNEYDKAEIFYQKAIELDPNKGDIYISYANFLRKIRNDIDKAEAHYKKAIDLNPKDPIVLSDYAIMLITDKSEYNKALILLKTAIDLGSENSNVFGNYAHLLIILENDFINAKRYIETAFELKPKIMALVAELWFYRYAHYKEFLNEGEIELEKLIANGVKSINWDLQTHVNIAKKNKHPDIKRLEYFAKAITSVD